MTSQHTLRERAALLLELRQIVRAMKNVAFAELQRLTRELPALAEARETVLRALDASMGRASDTAAEDAAAPPSWLVIGAERGFCGAFNARLASAIAQQHRAEPQARWLIAGSRLQGLLEPTVPVSIGLPGCPALDEADAALDTWIAVILDEARRGRAVGLLHAGDAGLVRRRLLPTPDEGGAGREDKYSPHVTPLHYLPLPALRAALLRQAVRLLLQDGLYASLEQENRWRMSQMQSAQDHLDELDRVLRRRRAASRQADITNELETLTSTLDRASVASPARMTP